MRAGWGEIPGVNPALTGLFIRRLFMKYFFNGLIFGGYGAFMGKIGYSFKTGPFWFGMAFMLSTAILWLVIGATDAK